MTSRLNYKWMWLTILLSLLQVQPAFGADPSFLWAKRLGGTGGDDAEGVATDSNGNVYLTGAVAGDADLNGDGDATDGGAESGTGYGQWDIFLSKFNSSGTFQWAKRLGGITGDQGTSTATDREGNVYVAGYVSGNADLNGDGDSTDGGAENTAGADYSEAVIVKFDSSGGFQWAKRLSAAVRSGVNGLALDSSGNVYAVGLAEGDADLNGDGDRTDGGPESSAGYGSNDIIISVFDSSGSFQWAKRLGGSNYDNSYGVAVDSSGNIYATGYVAANADLNGDGDSTDGGPESSAGYGAWDVFVAKFDSTGAYQWAKRLGGASYDDLGFGIATDLNGNVYLTGRVQGDADMNGDGDATDGGAESGSGFSGHDSFIAKFNSSGAWQWAKRLGGTGADMGEGVAVSAVNEIYAVGLVTGDADLNGDSDRTDGGAESSAGYGDNDVYLSKFDSSGTFQWAKRWGGTSLDMPVDATIDSSARLYVAGLVKNDADLNGDGDRTDGGAESGTGYGNSDAFVSVFTDAADQDSDGIVDTQEALDGSNMLDRGSNLPVLGTTLCSEWNGFLGGMWNIAEHVNLSSSTINVQSTLYDINGTAQGTQSFSVLPGAQQDLLVHDITGWTLNSYGKVCSTVVGGNAGDLDGRMVYYKTVPGTGDPDYSYQFAFAMPFLNGIKGQQVVPFNTFQPSLDSQDASNPVANWIQLTNLEATTQTGTLIFWSQQGANLGQQFVTLEAQARRDFCGHQFGSNLVGIVEWLPDNATAAFQLRNVRYFYDNATMADSFAAAFQLEGMVGNGQLLAVPLDTSSGSAILEVANASDAEINVTVKIYNAAGTLLSTQTPGLPAHGSVHIITDTILGGAQGLATIEGSALESVVATAMQYGRTPALGVQYLYGIAAKEALGTVLRSSYNTFLDQQCRLLIANSTEAQVNATVSMVRYDGTTVLAGTEVPVPAHGLVDYNLCEHDAADNYGVVTVQPDTPNTLTASVVRIGANNDYRFPTPVRQ